MSRGAPILLVHPTAELYGSDRVFLESVTALLACGKDVVVSLASRGPLEGELLARGVRVVTCPSPVLRRNILAPRGFTQFAGTAIRGTVQGARLIRSVKPEAIYVNTLTVPLWNLLAWAFRVPLVVHVHEGEASTGLLVRRALAGPLLLADVTIANSRFSAGVIESAFQRLGRRTRVVYNAVPGPADPPAVRAEISGPLRLAYVGRLSARKGVDVAIDAVALLVDGGLDVELDIAGAVFPGYEWYERQLHGQVASRRLEGRIHFHGFQPSIWPFIANCDVVLVPSRADEPFGNTAVEAILGRRPVIASATTGLLEATAGYTAARRVKPNDAGAIAAAVRQGVAAWPGVGRQLAADMEVARRRHGRPEYQNNIAAAVEQAILAKSGVNQVTTG